MKPPETIPENLKNKFTMKGLVGVRHMYIDQSSSKNTNSYLKETISDNVDRIKRGECGYYGITDKWLYEALSKYPVVGKTVALFGSTAPWYESVLIAYECQKCYVLDYNKIICDHDKIIAIDIKTQSIEVDADIGMSISSFEHDGLGRYGDPIDPDGDIKAMKKAKTAIKKGGLMFFSVPVGKDKVVWNAHRIYGKSRLPLMLEGWSVVESFGVDEEKLNKDTGADAECQPIYVLRND